MIEMHVGAIAIDKISGEPIVLLTDAENKRALPIWIGTPEARAISFAANKIATARPLTHNLLLSVIKRFGYDVKEIRIHELKDNSYKAQIVLAKENGNGHESRVAIDSRPSDAIALAMLDHAPLLVADDILSQAGISTDESDVEALDRKAFKNFVDGVKASDFMSFAADIESEKSGETDSEQHNEDSGEEQMP